MSYFSDIVWGRKKPNDEEMKHAAQGQSVLGNFLGSSPYIKQWGRDKLQIEEEFKNREKLMFKKWQKEDVEIARSLGKMQGKYERKMGPEKAVKYYGKYERDERQTIQRQRDREQQAMEQEKNEAIRNIQKNINKWKA